MKENYPWKNPVKSTGTYDVYEDGFPVNEGHLLFVPRVDEQGDVIKCLEAAYRYGRSKVTNSEWEAFNVGLNGGEAAGQTCSWSHVHLIPRFKGDMKNPIGGVRGVIPERQNYKEGDYYAEHRKRIYGSE